MEGPRCGNGRTESRAAQVELVKKRKTNTDPPPWGRKKKEKSYCGTDEKGKKFKGGKKRNAWAPRSQAESTQGMWASK